MGEGTFRQMAGKGHGLRFMGGGGQSQSKRFLQGSASNGDLKKKF
jgi:hypothetical protein